MMAWKSVIRHCHSVLIFIPSSNNSNYVNLLLTLDDGKKRETTSIALSNPT